MWVGYIFDDKIGNEKYFIVFGILLTLIYILIVGFGYKSENWEINLVYVYRMGSVNVDLFIGDFDVKSNFECFVCSYVGEYKI